MMIRFECFESPPASVRTGKEQAWEWGITAWFRQARMSVLGGREQQETGADCAPPRLGHGASSPRLMVCVCLSRGMAPGWRCWSLVRGPPCPCVPASRVSSQTLGSPGFSCCHTRELTFGLTHTDSSPMHTSGRVPQSFCRLGNVGLNPASLTCQGQWQSLGARCPHRRGDNDSESGCFREGCEGQPSRRTEGSPHCPCTS